MRRRSTSPPDTEAVHPDSDTLDDASTGEVLARLHREDARAVGAVGAVLPSLSRLADAAIDALRAGGRVIYVGAGTSGRLGALDAAECPPTFGSDGTRVVAVIAGGRRALASAVEGAEDDVAAGAEAMRAQRVGPKDLVIGVSASGSTPFVRGALTAARKARAVTGLVACTADPALGSLADHPVLPLTGPELVAGSTRLKAGTATKLVLNAISTAAFIRLGKVHRGRMIEARITNAKLRRRAEKTVAALTGLTPSSAAALLAKADDRVSVALQLHARGAKAPSRR